jgi:hypothetical protein
LLHTDGFIEAKVFTRAIERLTKSVCVAARVVLLHEQV